MIIDHWYIYLCVFAAVGFGIYSIAHVFDRYGVQLDARLGEACPEQTAEHPWKLVRNPIQDVANRTKSKYGGLGERLLPHRDRDRTYYQKRLLQAGFYEPASLELFFAIKFCLMIGPPIVAVSIAYTTHVMTLQMALLFGTIAGGFGMILPSFWVDRQIGKRHALLRKATPDFLDLTLICLRGGLSVQAALQRVSEELLLAHPVLAEEMTRVKRDIELGATVDAALRRFADRSGEDGIRTLSTFVRESRRFGVELADALRTHSDMLRNHREQEAEAKAQKAAVKILIPTLLLIFPAVFVVLAGPAAIQIQEAFAK
ncbi:MAG: type II secretion system F family protein [Pirellulales bacterium]